MLKNLTKGQKKMLALFLVVVALVIVLWVTGVFKGKGSGFRNNNRSGFKFGRVTNRSLFGAIGGYTSSISSDTSGPARFDIKYTNPNLFGTLKANLVSSTTGAIQSKWNGLLLSMSTATEAEYSLNSVTNPDVVGVALSPNNPFYQNRYLDALKSYYGDYPVIEGTTQLNSNYTALMALSDLHKVALQDKLQDVLSEPLGKVVVADITFNYNITDGEKDILKREITRLIKFIATFRSSPTFDPNNSKTNKYSDSNLSKKFNALEGVYVGIGNTLGTKREEVTLVTVRQSVWLDRTPGAYKFGVGIINSNLTITTDDKYTFPFMVSDMIESVTGLGRTTTADNPTGLTVDATYWE